MKLLLALLLAVFVTSINAEERYMPNDAGGFIVLTDDPCTIELALKQGFLNRTYADDEVNHYEGCWSRFTPPEEFQDRAEPFVNTWWQPGLTASYKQKLFGKEKKRWTSIVLDPIEVTPSNK